MIFKRCLLNRVSHLAAFTIFLFSAFLFASVSPYQQITGCHPSSCEEAPLIDVTCRGKCNQECSVHLSLPAAFLFYHTSRKKNRALGQRGLDKEVEEARREKVNYEEAQRRGRIADSRVLVTVGEGSEKAQSPASGFPLPVDQRKPPSSGSQEPPVL